MESRSQATVHGAAALALAAALVHLIVAPDHLREWWGYGAFFLMAAALQVLFGLALLRRPRPWLLLAGIAGHLALISLYMVTRTVGLPPVGPLAGETEPVGALDLLSKSIEIGLVIVLSVLLRGAYRSRTASA